MVRRGFSGSYTMEKYLSISNRIAHRNSSEVSLVYSSTMYSTYRLGNIKIISSMCIIMTDTLCNYFPTNFSVLHVIYSSA